MMKDAYDKTRDKIAAAIARADGFQFDGLLRAIIAGSIEPNDYEKQIRGYRRRAESVMKILPEIGA